ncbi:AraC-like DNA-binding protein [Mucilaginibacter yixingensis]|uniref:AraC-like DNA-binding protein n=1 Tax=Mucilaginibacter yixingensis TaxID=1295612 RepID=A0A2T5J8G2_9SPHI|nr:AraC family transcriptional regulator [Mucilaginibacter yixingensis]PTQ95753.1 AraC-like DNA-binding protein [Mucilaginibacter yixingensis]
MKPHFLKVAVKPQNSFSIRHDILPTFRGIWHYHPELELHYVIKGEGVRFIGDNISNFSAGEVTLLGENLPHCWRCKEEYFVPESDLNVEVIVIHFLPDCLGRYLLNLPEAYLLPKLFEKAKSGMSFTGKARTELTKLMHQAVEATNIDRIIVLLSILKVLAETDEFDNITLSPSDFHQSNESDTIRLNKVCSYTLANYKKEIGLQEIAAIGNLSVTSFCRYFKLMTKKTYSDFLTEIRISHACRFLIEDKMPTEVLCFECGFNNVSNFYRHFKKVTNMTPLEYKRKYLKGQPAEFK